MVVQSLGCYHLKPVEVYLYCFQLLKETHERTQKKRFSIQIHFLNLHIAHFHEWQKNKNNKHACVIPYGIFCSYLFMK